MTIATDFWYAYVVNHIMDRCVALSKERCQGCLQKWKSSFLHEHEQLPLFAKVEYYLEEVRIALLKEDLVWLYH